MRRGRALVTGESPEQHEVVLRRGLFDRLASARRVTVLSGPAGSGKTVLVGSWIAAAGLEDRVARISVRREEHDPTRLWLSALDALRRTPAGSLGLREVTAAPGVDAWTMVRRLVNDLDSLEEPVWLVIDDSHELASSEACRQLEFLLMHAPETLRLVLISRRQPRLRLHHLRLQGELTEIRASDLRLTRDEALELIKGGGVELSDSAASDLLERTEGWAAGLRLAVQSLVEHPDPPRFATEFSGTERTVADYLLAEVLEQQPNQFRHLLLRTAVLDRVSGPLADALTGGTGGERILQELESGNAFVVSLDAGRSWFRYHRVFADFLRLELRRTAPDDVRSLHLAAAEWLADHDYPIEAIRHAQAAGNWGLAVRLLADQWFSLSVNGDAAAAHELIAAFPSGLRMADPALTVLMGADELLHGSLEGAKRQVAVATRQSTSSPAAPDRRCRLMLGVLRLGVARQSADVTTVAEESERLIAAVDAVQIAPLQSGHDLRAVATISLGAAELWAGRVDEADRDLEHGLAIARRIGRPHLEVTALAHWAVVASVGSLRVAAERSEKTIELARRHGWRGEPAAALADLVLGLTCVWQGRLNEAESRLAEAERGLRIETDPAAGTLLRAGRGWLELARDRNEDALVAFRTADRLADRLVAPNMFTRATRSQLLQTMVRLGDIAGVERTLADLAAEERGSGEIRIAAALGQIAQNDPLRATEVLAPVLDGTAPALSPQVWMVQAFLVDSIARDLVGDTTAAERALERALDLAEPDGVLLPFLLHPAPGLLERHSTHRTRHASLLSEIIGLLAGQARRPRLAEPEPSFDPLTATETRVLRYLPTHLSLREVGNELYLSVNTIKAHIRSIYAKLDVHSRGEAIERARAVGLLAPSSRTR